MWMRSSFHNWSQKDNEIGRFLFWDIISLWIIDVNRRFWTLVWDGVKHVNKTWRFSVQMGYFCGETIQFLMKLFYWNHLFIEIWFLQINCCHHKANLATSLTILLGTNSANVLMSYILKTLTLVFAIYYKLYILKCCRKLLIMLHSIRCRDRISSAVNRP